ncbi:MAG: alcohol dehydrogenase catalytic domain-containing protein [Clostridiales bacterium]|nr:alcohol dehydrogenase catalytic domain-containing protein [Clostridiales bacterium]
MKAARNYGEGVIKIEDLVLPPIKEDEVKIAVEWAGICGSDKHGYERKGPRPAPSTMGHEFSGTVIEVGALCKRIQVGDRVVVNPIFFCGKCAECIAGNSNNCENTVMYGLSGIQGAFSEETTVLETMVTKIPDNLPLDIAALAEPTCIGAHALRLSKFRPGMTAAVLGVGAIGLLLVSLLKASGCTKIIATARTKSKRDLAEELGADFTFDPSAPDAEEIIKGLNKSCDIVFEVSGAQESFTMAHTMLKFKGDLVVISLPGKPFELPIGMVVNKEISVIGSRCTNGEFPWIVELMASGAINAAPVITKKIYLDDLVEEGFETLMKDNEQLKILVTPKRENVPV